MQDALVLLIVAAAAFFVIRKYVKAAKSGKCCGSDCSGDGNCSSSKKE